MGARRYEISARVLKNIFQHEKRNFVSPSNYVIFFLLYITLACFRLSISASERKQRRAKNQAIQGVTLLMFSFFPAASRTDPLTEGLEQANITLTIQQKMLYSLFQKLRFEIDYISYSQK